MIIPVKIQIHNLNFIKFYENKLKTIWPLTFFFWKLFFTLIHIYKNYKWQINANLYCKFHILWPYISSKLKALTDNMLFYLLLVVILIFRRIYCLLRPFLSTFQFLHCGGFPFYPHCRSSKFNMISFFLKKKNGSFDEIFLKEKIERGSYMHVIPNL